MASKNVGGLAVGPTADAMVTRAEPGDPLAAQQLFERLYVELHRLAKREMYRHGGGLSINATTLLHEAYLKLAGRDDLTFPDEARFMGYAARAMRGLIIDYARNRHALKRGGGFAITSLSTNIADNAAEAADHHELTRMSDALDGLATSDPALAQLVDLKFFCGFSLIDIATMRGVSERTAQRDWEKARIYLHHRLSSEDANPA